MSFPAADGRLSTDAIRHWAIAVRAVAVAGIILFGGLALVATAAPAFVERAAHGYTSQRLHDEIESLVGGFVEISQLIDDPELVQRYAAQLTARGAELRAAVTRVLDKLVECSCRHDCAARAKARIAFDAIVAAAPAEMGAAVTNIQAIAQGRFDIIFAKLSRELLLISLINTAIFAALLVVAWVGKATRALILPAALLSASIVITAGIYLFGTNWWWAVLTDGYWGMGYLTVDGIVTLFLCDIFFLEGRVTLGLIEGISDALSVLVPKC